MYQPFKLIFGLLIAVVVIVAVSIYWPIAQVEIGYLSDQIGSVKYVVGEAESYNTFQRSLVPVNTDFSIIIPKINAVAPIVDKVDPNQSYEYLPALQSGVAHALGSANPGDGGNVYLIAHSDDAFYNVPKYNTVFFLLGKLSKGDDIYIYYKGRTFKYVVDQVKVISSGEIDYSAGNPDQKTLTIQTDYPPGLTFKRLIVTANDAGIQ
jgi:LPXTG-site transpeptidase (sortase) family protein